MTHYLVKALAVVSTIVAGMGTAAMIFYVYRFWNVIKEAEIRRVLQKIEDQHAKESEKASSPYVASPTH